METSKLRYGDNVRVKTYLGDIRKGRIKQVNDDGSLYVEIKEQLIPDLIHDIVIRDKKGNPFVIYKSKFPSWQAWIKPEWAIEIITEEETENDYQR